LQAIDSSEVLSLVQEENIFPNDRASTVLQSAFRGEVSGVLHKLAHLILQNSKFFWEFMAIDGQFDATIKWGSRY
jgi:hypothetical protein